jgi:hypothetical protein
MPNVGIRQKIIAPVVFGEKHLPMATNDGMFGGVQAW